MPSNGHNNGHSRNGPFCRVDSRHLSAVELSETLDMLLASQNQQGDTEQFPGLVQLLDGVSKVNPHQHITGSVGSRDLLERVIGIYQQDSDARSAFLDYVASRRILAEDELGGFFLQSQEELLRWFEVHIPLPGDPDDFKEADDRLGLVRLAFQSDHDSSLELLKEAYRTVAMENMAHGVTEVWFRTSLGDHESDAFIDAAKVALEGAGAVNEDTDIPISVRFLVGMRKHYPTGTSQVDPNIPTDARAEDLVSAVSELRERMPGARVMLLGIDSVGMDSHWRPEWQASARSAALKSKFHVAVHFGESWHEGELVTRLEMLYDLVKHGVIHQLDNANALFAVKDLMCPHQAYSNDEWAEIRRLQRGIFETLADRGIALGINPTSNDLLTRSLRSREGWRFRALTEPLAVGQASVVDLMLGAYHRHRPLVIVVGNDNSRLYPARIAGSFLTVSEELANLWDAPGSTYFSVYGKLSTEIIAQLIRNGFMLSQSANDGGDKSLLQPRVISARSPQLSVSSVLEYPHIKAPNPEQTNGLH